MSVVGKAVGRVIAGLLLGCVLAVGGVAYSVWSVAREDNRQQADTIVVLGSAQYNGTPSQNFQARLKHAMNLYEDGYAKVIVTVGGNRAGDVYTEASAGKKWLEEQGVPSSAVVAVPEGSNTLQSAIALKKVYRQHGWQTADMVTDPWHCLRASQMLEENGIKVFISPTRTGPAVASRSTEIAYVFRETAAILYYGLNGSSQETGIGIG